VHPTLRVSAVTAPAAPAAAAGLDGLGGLGGDEELGLAELLSGLSLLAAKPQPPDPRK
jgi:hypothetical protein